MPIISKIEAKTLRGRLIYAGIILALSVGGLTMIYPFMIMISGSLRSEMDQNDLDLIPAYMVDQDVLYRKFLETKYNQSVDELNRAHLQQNFSFRDAKLPSQVVPAQIKDFQQFLRETDIPYHWQGVGGVVGVKITPENLRELRQRLEEKYQGDLDAFSRDMGVPVHDWNTIIFPKLQWFSQRFNYEDNVLFQTFFELLRDTPWADRQLVSISGYFLESAIFPDYGQNLENYNAAHALPLASFSEFVLPDRVPDSTQPRLRTEWIGFVQKELNPSFVILPQVEDAVFQAYLGENYPDIQALNQAWSSHFASMDEVVLPQGEWLQGTRRVDYQQFLLTQPVEAYQLLGPEYAWRSWLGRKYSDTEQLNAAHQAAYADFASAKMPVAQLEYVFVQENAGSLRWTYAARNFINVLDQLFRSGNVFRNTVIFCSLTILLSLLVNPLAAYAMSRFKLPGTYKILLLLMATMSFPPMVTLIPQFIVLRKMDLLNTFIALALPFAANGYWIFLLKGFFDSLPQELYEAATIDGASEIRMFFQITMALSKPILAVVALQTFTQAYMQFLYPLVVAPAQDMWLLNVWLFQWQQNASTAGVFASVLIACIPTLLVFIFAQNVIMRGIVVPTEK